MCRRGLPARERFRSVSRRFLSVRALIRAAVPSGKTDLVMRLVACRRRRGHTEAFVGERKQVACVSRGSLGGRSNSKSDFLRAVITMNDVIRYLPLDGLSNLKAIFIL